MSLQQGQEQGWSLALSINQRPTAAPDRRLAALTTSYSLALSLARCCTVQANCKLPDGNYIKRYLRVHGKKGQKILR